MERVREDCDIKHKEQGYLHREEFQWALIGALLLGGIAGVWSAGAGSSPRRKASAASSARSSPRETNDHASPSPPVRSYSATFPWEDGSGLVVDVVGQAT